MITVDTKDIDRLERDLYIYSSKALPYAIRGTHKAKAFKTMAVARDFVDNKFILRNKWTVKSIQVEPGRDKSIVGSVAPYMLTQEFGGSKSKKGKEGTPITTSYASGEGEGTKLRKKIARPRNRLKNLTFSKARVRAVSKKQELLLLVRKSVETGQRVFFYDNGRGKKGIYRVLGGRKTVSGWPKGATIHMLHDLSRVRVYIPKEPWLLPATLKVQKQTNEIYIDQLKRQIEINRLFRERRRLQ